MFRGLPVAFDSSSHAQRAFAQARDLVRPTAGRLTVMTVVPPRAFGGDYRVAVNVKALMARIQRE